MPLAEADFSFCALKKENCAILKLWLCQENNFYRMWWRLVVDV